MNSAGSYDVSAHSRKPILAANGDSPTESRGDGDEDSGEDVKLYKSVSLFSGTTLIVGTMIGSGIFVSPRGVLIGSGSVAMSLIVWAGCGLLSTLGALVYAELGTTIIKSGAEHAYLLHTFKPMGKCWGQVPAFLVAWLGIFIIRPSMFAIMVLSLGTYATQPFYTPCEAPALVKKMVTLVAMVLIAFINCASVKVATKVQDILTGCKLVAIAIISIGGIYKIATVELPSMFAIMVLSLGTYATQPFYTPCEAPALVKKMVTLVAMGSTSYISEGFQDTESNPSIIALAFYNGLWAYDGWNNLNFVTEELKNPKRNLPLAIAIGIPLTTVCYILVNIGYFSVISKEEILLSDAVAVTWGDKILGVMTWIIPVFVVLSCFGSANGSLFASGRLCYAAAREGHQMQVLSYIDIFRHTPVTALIFTTVVAILMILPSDLGRLIDFFGFAAWIFYGLTCASCIVLRYTQPDLPRPYKVPIFVPVLVVLASIYLVIAPIIQNPRMEFFYALLFIFSGLFFYFPCVYYKLSLPGVDIFSRFVQKIFQVAPSHHFSK